MLTILFTILIGWLLSLTGLLGLLGISLKVWLVSCGIFGALVHLINMAKS